MGECDHCPEKKQLFLLQAMFIITVQKAITLAQLRQNKSNKTFRPYYGPFNISQ